MQIALPYIPRRAVVGAADEGGLGFYFHNHGNLLKVMRTSARAWTDPEMNRPDAPPQMAPLAFAGLGAIGALASLKRFNMPA